MLIGRERFGEQEIVCLYARRSSDASFSWKIGSLGRLQRVNALLLGPRTGSGCELRLLPTGAEGVCLCGLSRAERPRVNQPDLPPGLFLLAAAALRRRPRISRL